MVSPTLTRLGPAARFGTRLTVPTLPPSLPPRARLLSAAQTKTFDAPTFKLHSGKEMPTIAWGNYDRQSPRLAARVRMVDC